MPVARNLEISEIVNITMEFIVGETVCQGISSVTQSCPTLCDPMNRSTSGLPVHHQLSESTQTHVRWIGDAIQPSHPLSSPSPPILNLSQHHGLFRVSSLHQVAKVLELQLQNQSYQWTPRTDCLQDGLVGSTCSPRDSSRVFSNTTVKKCQFFGAQLYSPAVTSIHDHCQRIGRIKKFFDYFVLISRVGGGLVAKLCLTLETPWNCSTPGSSVHGIFQTRILECVAISSCRGSSQPRDWTWISCIAGRFFTDWATREVY